MFYIGFPASLTAEHGGDKSIVYVFHKVKFIYENLYTIMETSFIDMWKNIVYNGHF